MELARFQIAPDCLDIDVQALRKIRAAIGDTIDFYVDANGAYTRAEAPNYVRVIAAEGAQVAEDPCPLQADDEFTAFQANALIPILVDSPCASVRDAATLLQRYGTLEAALADPSERRRPI